MTFQAAHNPSIRRWARPCTLRGAPRCHECAQGGASLQRRPLTAGPSLGEDEAVLLVFLPVARLGR